ncbi:MAG: hypothetical protein K6A68_04010 [Clostridiales bacterium]|nr:hypothetical protein [Clostridiales bacterium]
MQQPFIIENLGTANVELTDAEFNTLEASLNQCKVYGHRGLGGFGCGLPLIQCNAL